MAEQDTVTLDTLDNEIQVVDDKASFAIDRKSMTPMFVGFDEVHAANEQVLARLMDYKYDGSEDERKNNNKFMAQVRKRKQAMTKRANDFKREFFDDFDHQVKVIAADYDAVIELANSRKAESDAKFKAERMAALVDAFSGTAVMDERLDGLSADDFIDASMLNRSTTEVKARAALEHNIETYTKVIGLSMMPEWDGATIAAALSAHSWDAIETLAAYKESEALREQRAALDAKRRVDEEARKAEAARRTILKLSIPTEKVAAAKAALDQAGIEYEVIA